MRRMYIGLIACLFLVHASVALADCDDITEDTQTGDSTATETVVYSDEVYLTEILPNPSTSESADEFIELYNASSNTVDLTGWILADASTNDYELSGSISSQHYIVIYRSDSGLALNNGGDVVELSHPNGERTDYIEYTESAADDIAYALDSDGEWYWTTTPTPYRANTITAIDDEAVETEDNDTDSADTDEGSAADDDNATNTSEQHQLSANVQLSEFLPDPTGSDATDEWIELANTGAEAVNLNDWELHVGDDSYTIPDTVTIAAAGYSIFPVTVTGLSLNNGGEEVLLVDPTGEMMDSVTYDDAPTGSSYARSDAGWQWTTTLTQGAANVLTTATSAEATTTDAGATTDTETTEASTTGNPTEVVVTQTIAAIKQLDSGADVVTQGVVTVLPEIFSSNYFYIQDDTGGIQVYSSDKSFPELTVGDVVTVTGSRGTSNGEAKINTDTADDIVIIAQDQVITAATDLIDTTTNAGRVVTTSGVIGSKSGSTITLDSGVAVYVKRNTGISTSSFVEGETVHVTGVLVVTEDDTQVWPRSTADIVFGELTETATGQLALDQGDHHDASGTPDTVGAVDSSQAVEQTITTVAPYWPWLALGLGLASLGLLHWLWQNTRLRDWVRARVRVLGKRLGYSVGSEKNTTDSSVQSQYHESHLWEKINV